jgi:hypothetical protein
MTTTPDIKAQIEAVRQLDEDLRIGMYPWLQRDALRAALATLQRCERAPFRWFHPSRWRHKKRGSAYNVLTATAAAQCSTGPINEGDHVTVYQADDGNWYVRKTSEFQDGRFERIDLTEGWPATTQNAADPKADGV